MSGLTYLSATDEAAVGDGYDLGGSNFAGEVLIFHRSDFGNAAPTRNISGANTGASSGVSWSWVIGLPLEVVFEDGFE